MIGQDRVQSCELMPFWIKANKWWSQLYILMLNNHATHKLGWPTTMQEAHVWFKKVDIFHVWYWYNCTKSQNKMTLFENILEEKEQEFQPRRLIYCFRKINASL